VGDAAAPARRPLGILGHVNAALELAAQVAGGELPEPSRIVLPLGTGGTAAGLALGCRIAGMSATIVGVRVVPRLVARAGRVVRLANETAALIRRYSTARLPRVVREDVMVVHDYYGGAYGRETAAGRDAARRFALEARVTLDATYTAKACAAALARSGRRGGDSGVGRTTGPTLVWLTFDARTLNADEGGRELTA
jgi:D-cysteine desulfhydrase